MYLFILLSVPCFLIHRARNHGINLLLEHRKYFFNGLLWGSLAGLLLFLLSLSMEQIIEPAPLYIYSLLLYFLIPILLALAPLLPLYLGNKKKGITEPAASEIPFIGFFTSCNMAIYFIYHNDYGQFFPLFLPLFYLISIPVLAKILWHWRRLNLHWNLISLLLLATILCLVPLVYLFHSMLRPLLAWGIAAGILSFYLLFNKFLNNLEQGIGFRLNIEMKVGSLFHSK